MERWIANAVGLMHINHITQKEVAAQLGVTNDYVSMILTGKKSPKGAEKRINTAINDIISDRQSDKQDSN